MKLKYNIGQFVRYNDLYGNTNQGIIYEATERCNQSLQWIAAQNIKVTKDDMMKPWYGILLDGNGTVYIQESRLTEIKPFRVANFALELYHQELLKFIPTNVIKLTR